MLINSFLTSPHRFSREGLVTVLGNIRNLMSSPSPITLTYHALHSVHKRTARTASIVARDTLTAWVLDSLCWDALVIGVVAGALACGGDGTDVVDTCVTDTTTTAVIIIIIIIIYGRGTVQMILVGLNVVKRDVAVELWSIPFPGHERASSSFVQFNDFVNSIHITRTDSGNFFSIKASYYGVVI